MKRIALVLMLAACFASLAQDSVVTDPDKLREITDTYRSNTERPKDFIPQGDGTVVDKRTGLQWMRCNMGQTWTGKTCSGEAKEYDWHTAMKLRAEFAGYDDWRLPTIAELETLVYCRSGMSKGRENGMISACKGEDIDPTIAEKIFLDTVVDSYWSSSSDEYDDSDALAVMFYLGFTSPEGKQFSFPVRLVRDGQ